MSIKKDGIMVILSSPSGAGKTTLVKLLSKKKIFHISVSHTTRKPRPNEIEDKDYYFVSHDKFKNLIFPYLTQQENQDQKKFIIMIIIL